MRSSARALQIVGVLCLLSTITLAASPAATATPAARATSPAAAAESRSRALAAYGAQPLQFEANQGQTDPAVRFLARGPGYTVFLTDAEAVLVLAQPSAAPARHRLDPAAPLVLAPPPSLAAEPPAVLRMSLVGANPSRTLEGRAPLPGTVNYFMGRDPAKWRTNIPTYAKVQVPEVYPGIELVYYGNPRQLEYDFVVAPGADPGLIRLAFAGADDVRLDARGDLLLLAGGRELLMHRPVVYQTIAGVRREIASQYVALPAANADATRIGIRIAAWDRTRPLVIDPVLSYYTDLGGAEYFQDGYGIAVDNNGSAYVTGATLPINFATGTHVIGPGGGNYAFVVKLDVNGSIVYTTYLSGTGEQSGNAIAVDHDGNAYVTGATSSLDFPVLNAFQPSFGGTLDAFVTKLNAKGSALVYSTYLGGAGHDGGLGIGVDGAGGAYVTGFTESFDFPTANPLQGVLWWGRSSFIVKLLPDGSDVVYSTYLGGTGTTMGNAIAVDGAGNAYVTGQTDSLDFPIVSPIQPYLLGSSNAFVTKLDPKGAAFVYSTYLGGSGDDAGYGIAVDAAGSAYVTGTTSSNNFPLAYPYQSNPRDIFVSKLNPAGSALVYSTYLGGTGVSAYGRESAHGIAVDGSGNAHVTGQTISPDFPTVNAVRSTLSGVADAFVTRFDATGSFLVYSTYLGSSASDIGEAVAVDPNGNAYVVGGVGPNLGEVGSLFVAKLTPIFPDLTPTSVNVTPTINVPGGNLTASVAVMNAGEARVGAGWTVRFYLAQGRSRAKGDLLFSASAPGAPLDVGQRATLTTSLAMPKTQRAGNYYVIACADDTNQVAEMSETNNCRASSLIAVIRPDLTITALSVAAPAVAGVNHASPGSSALPVLPGSQLTALMTVLNQGGAPAPVSTVRFYLATGSTRGRADLRLAVNQAVPALNPGTNVASATLLTIPTTTPLGVHNIIACADDFGVAAESDETNNCRASNTFQVTRPDLTVTALTITPPVIGRGGAITATTSVWNQGLVSAPGSTMRFYLATGTTRAATDVLLAATQAIPVLGPSVAVGASTTLTLPTTAAVRSYYIIGCADDLGQVAETDETNNCRASNALQVTLPDLTVTTLTITPPVIGPGGTITATANVRNQGLVSAPGSTMRFYLATGTVRTQTDVLLTEYQAVPPLHSLTSVNTSTKLTIPKVAVHDYFIIGCADDLRVIAETNETNNCQASGSVHVRKPDLVISAVAVAPATVVPGHALTATTEVRNQADVPATASTVRFYLAQAPTRGRTDLRLSATQAVTGLTGSAVAVSTSPLAIPASVAPGTYYVIACADDRGQVAESDESNNCRATGGTVQVTRPPLRLLGASTP